MGSLVVKRSIVVSGHKTSVSLEDAFWNALKEIAKARNVTGLSQATVRPQRRSHHGVNFLGRGMSFGLVAAARATQKQPQNKGLSD